MGIKNGLADAMNSAAAVNVGKFMAEDTAEAIAGLQQDMGITPNP